MLPSNRSERRKSMQFIVKSINPRGRVLPKLQDQKQVQSSNLRFSRKDVLSYNPMYIDREPLRIYKKPVLFQLNFEYNRTLYPRKAQERDYKQLRRLEVQGYERNNLLLVTVGNRKSLNQPDQALHSFQQKISQALMTKSELLTAVPMSGSLPTSSVQFDEPAQAPIVFDQIQRSMCKASPEKRKNLQFDNSDGTFKFYVGPGNNGQLVKSVLEKRGSWTETSESNSMFNLKWTQTCERVRFDAITSDSGHNQLFNHFEFHEQISTKSGLLRNLRAFCERDQKNSLFEITPLTFQVDFKSENCDQDLKRFLFFYLENVPSRNQIPKQKRKEEQRKNFLEFLKSIKHIHNVQNLTYDKKEHPNSKAIMKDVYTDGQTYLWLLKPTGLNRGRGIYLFRNLDELRKILDQYFQKNQKAIHPRSPSRRHSSAKQKPREAQGSNAIVHNPFIRSESFVIQKYIQKPMLIRSRKYDIRVWVLLTHQMDLYFFKEGYIRTSCEQYSLQKNDLYVHLTNNAVQKNSCNYGTYEKGNQLSFDDLEQQFKQLDRVLIVPPVVPTCPVQQSQQRPPTAATPSTTVQPAVQLIPEKVSFRKHILPELKRITALSIQSVKKKINQNDRRFCFQIFGYDFMIDDNLKPWLIQVNTNPCIQQSSPILEKLLPRMLHNAFQLTLDVLFPLKSKLSQHKPKYPVNGFTDDENMWEFLASYKTQKRRLRK